MIPNPYRDKSLFVAIGGLNGCGKTTQVKLLGEWLRQKGYEVAATKEPTDRSAAGQRVRRILCGEKPKPPPEELQLLFAEDRFWDNAKVVLPALRDGQIVIADRHAESSRCFGRADGVPGEVIEALNGKFLRPDLTLILALPLEALEQRLRERERAEGRAAELFHSLPFLTAVWSYYERYRADYPEESAYLVDGSGSPGEVHERVKRLVTPFLPALT